MRGQHDDAGLFPGNFRDDIFHRETPDRRIGVEVICFELAAGAGQLGLNVILQFGYRRRAGRARTEADLFGHMSEGAFAIKAAGLFRRRRVITGLRQSGSGGAQGWWLACRAARFVAAGLATGKAGGQNANDNGHSQN